MSPMLAAVATAALPILLVVLVLGGVAKLAAGVRRGDSSEVSPGSLSRLGPAALMPERFAKPATILCAIAEFVFAAGLMFVDHPAARWPTVAFFAVATFVLWDLRRRRPDVGCGCFGEASSAPVGLRSMGRTIVLTAMAVAVALENVTGTDAVTALLTDPTGASIGATAPTGMAGAWFGGGVLLLLALSPEIDQALARLRRRVPCERRPQAAARDEARLRSSTAWRTHAGMLESDEPTDTWRELCWRFFVFPARDSAEVVFAVYLDGRRPDVRFAIVTEDAQPLPSSHSSQRTAQHTSQRTSLGESTPVSV